MQKLYLLAVAVSVSACVPAAPPAPAPQSLRVPGTPQTVVQRASAQLVTDGFEIAVSDGSTGTLVGRRVRGSDGNTEYIACGFAKNSIADAHHKSTLTVSLTARPISSDSSNVVLNGSVLSEYPDLTGIMAKTPNEKDCTSRGIEESRIAAAIAASQQSTGSP